MEDRSITKITNWPQQWKYSNKNDSAQISQWSEAVTRHNINENAQKCKPSEILTKPVDVAL